ncbi:hypothetical protein WA026_023187 [Henosepilachna vigintioctopunctata]|uniref:Uncharacterized protein n=1 Tax=Henosepilachna vigintioctopunctata TaxID=420089 RepID=A0AAW1UP27_9CUCU
MICGRLSQSAVFEKLLREEEKGSESQQSNCSDPAEGDLPLSERNSCFTRRDKVTYHLSNAAADVVRRLITPIFCTGRNLTIGSVLLITIWSRIIRFLL